MNISGRFIIYVTEQSFLISLTSLVAMELNIKAVFLGFFIAYRIDFVTGFLHIFDTYSGIYNLIILFILSFVYYSIESKTNHGIAEDIFKSKIISKYQLTKKEIMSVLLIRDLIRSFFISCIVNSLFALKYNKLLQSYYDHRHNLVSIINKDENRKSLFLKYVYSSMIMYYSIFFILLIIYTFIDPSSPLASSGVKSKSAFHYWVFFKSILNNNLTLDISEYMIGGFSLFVGTFIELFSSNIYEAVIISSMDSTHGFSSFVKFILPQFFPETMGYVFGMSIALIITDIILSFIQSLVKNEKSEYFTKRVHDLSYNLVFYFLLSVSLLIVGALIESSLGIYNF
ncbi:MAG: hypothetical protein AMDU2_EPLC00006G0661 [Thermoplasmatales archaeon E-plasma]|jgi:hypothetical protein|nr:MAG: hypothetical protein AMDU2_EPLC00006G0661 [Thermoplasmatales archaeon E-plasma]